MKVKQYKESAEVGEGEILVTIEHCTNCAEHQSNTRHIEEKYYLYARTLQQAILLRYPTVRVSCKPITNTVEDYMRSFSVDRRNPDQKSLIIDNHRPVLRIGAFEVLLCTRVKGELRQDLLHSKLASRIWPSIGVILGKICTPAE